VHVRKAMFRAQRRREKTRTDTGLAVLPVSPGFLVRSQRVCNPAAARQPAVTTW